MNKCIAKHLKNKKLKCILLPYYKNREKKFERFTICLIWKKDNQIKVKISIPNTICVNIEYKYINPKNNRFSRSTISCVDYLDKFHHCGALEIHLPFDELNIIITSDIKDMTFYHYMEQPKSMLCRKLIGYYLMNERRELRYNWLPNCFVGLYLTMLKMVTDMFDIYRKRKQSPKSPKLQNMNDKLPSNFD